MPELETTIAGLRLRNPLILASGILGETGKTLERVIDGGAGGVTTKSIGLEPRNGHTNPTVAELEFGLLNAMGLPNPGMADYKSELQLVQNQTVPVIGSIFGKDAGEFSKLAGMMADCGVSAIELNLSCPHASGYGAELGSDSKTVKAISSEVKSAVNLPVLVKLTPNTADIVALGRAAVDGGCDALVAINTVKAMAINPEVGMPILSNRFGGYSGPGIKPIGLRCVYELAAAEFGVPIIGAGGITTGQGAIEYIMAGASAVQIGTAVYYDGISVFDKLKSEITEFMEKNRYNSIKDMVGLAIRK